MNKTQIIEVGIELKSLEDYEFLEKLLHRCGFNYYVEPSPQPPYASLEDLECQCEGK